MRTRTLLILAVCCGLAILLAGGIKLLGIANDSPTGEDLRIGASATAGDATVTVLSVSEVDGRMAVHVRLAGVDDPAGTTGFALIVDGALLRVEAASSAGDCHGITVAEQSCDLVFDTHAAKGSARVLLLRRGEDQRRWALA